MKTDEKKEIINNTEKGPPILGSWRNIYIFVLAFQALLILCFFLIMIYYKV